MAKQVVDADMLRNNLDAQINALKNKHYSSSDPIANSMHEVMRDMRVQVLEDLCAAISASSISVARIIYVP